MTSFVFVGAEGGDELGGKVDDAGVSDQQFESTAELDHESRFGGSVEIDLRESHVLAYCAACSTARCAGFGFMVHPPMLPPRRGVR